MILSLSPSRRLGGQETKGDVHDRIAEGRRKAKVEMMTAGLGGGARDRN